MKRILFTMLLSLFAGLLYSQTTYYWVGGASPSSFTSNSNWNTALDGSGSTRVASATTDILIFDGTNIGGSIPATGLVTATATSTTCGQLKLQNGALVNLGRASAGSANITISGDGSPAEDFVVGAGCTLTLGMAVYNYDVRIVLAGVATGSVNGTVYLSPLSSPVHTASYITAAAANSLIFQTGSVCHISDSTSSSGFNGSVAGSIIFKTGASLYYYTGRSPVGNNSTTQFTLFEPGSNLYFMNSNVSYIDGTTAYASSSWVNQKILANLYVLNNSTLKADGPVHKIENFTIDDGASFITHSSGNTPVVGDLIVNGTLNAPSGSSNILVLGGSSPQAVSGTGIINIPALTVANYSDVTFSASVSVLTAANIYGKVDFGATKQITGPGTFTSRVDASAASVSGNTTAGSFIVTGVTGTIASVVGLKITGPGIDANTNVIGFSGTNATLNLSKPAIATTTGSAFTFTSDTAIIATAHPSGLDSLNGSVVVVGSKTFQNGTSYIINGATSWPFGVTSGSTANSVTAAFVEINAPVTVNRGISVSSHLSINGKMTLRPLDEVNIVSGAVINGTPGASNYIVTDYNSTTGDQSIVKLENIATAALIPIGTTNNYLPVTITPASSSDFSLAVFEGITSNGMITGSALTPAQKQTVVNAVWNINRLTGSGNADLQLGWATALEGSTFTTLPSSDIGLIINNGSSWSLPTGTGDNTGNTVLATVSSFGSFSAGAVPPTQPFVFNAIPVKTYGDADFNGGATSLNTTQPIIYSSSDPAVATIVNGDIHIAGAGVADITASQASDGFYPAASVTHTLTVNKAALTITADDKLKFEGQANPALTATYTGFVLSETPVVLLTPAVLTTTAVLASAPGTYPITVTGATSGNYDIVFTNGVLTVQPKQNQAITFNALPVKTYGNADFAAGGSSTNNTIPVTYASSNTSVATIIGSTIHIVGAGTSTITASQAGNAGYFPAADVARTLTVNKVNLTVRVRDTTKIEGQVNPDFTMTYTGFVLGETASNLGTAPVIETSATINSAAGYYAVTPVAGVSQNYNFIYVAGRLTIYPPGGNGQQYMHAFMSNSTTLNVRVFSVEPALGDIRLYDLAGRPLLKKNFYMPAGFATTTIQIPTLPSGLYVVTITGNGVDLKKTIPIIK